VPDSHDPSGDESVTPEENAEDLRALETDLLNGLLAAAEDKRSDTETIEIARTKDGESRVFFKFRIRVLEEDEYDALREKYTTYERSRRMGGLKIPQRTDTVKMRAEIIFEATVPEDQERLWKNKAAWDRLGVMGPIDLIDKVLLAGEKDAVIQRIERLSGYDLDLEETAKNS
jgi:hypothetical protein